MYNCHRLSYQSILSPTSILPHQFSHINTPTSSPYVLWFGFCFFEVYGVRYRLASSRYTEPDIGLIRNLQVSSFVSHPPHKNSIFWWSKSILDIIPVGKYGARYRLDTKSPGKLISLSSPPQKSHFLMIQIYVRYPSYGQIRSQIQAWYKIFR